MEKYKIELPFLFGDHHVIEIRKILGELPGVTDLYVSSSFHTVEVNYDPEVINTQKITACLEEAGYLGETGMPVEFGVSSVEENLNSPYFRKSNVYEATRKVTSFTQIIGINNRRLWPCPGFGVILSLKQTL
jgi:copper chaperone CopZ